MTAAPMPPSARPHIRSFHPRRGRVTVRQAEAIERLWPAYGVEIDGRPLDLVALFGDHRPVVLEIGFGSGEVTALMAAADPSTAIFAVDVHTPGIGQLLATVEAEGLTSVRVARGDAVELLGMLAPRSLAGVRLFFPDPWPKVRHHKRRLVRPSFAAEVAGRLRSGGVLHLATDWADYVDHMRAVLDAEPRLRLLHGGPVGRPAWRPTTRYERSGLEQGRPSADLLYVRT